MPPKQHHNTSIFMISYVDPHITDVHRNCCPDDIPLFTCFFRGSTAVCWRIQSDCEWEGRPAYINQDVGLGCRGVLDSRVWCQDSVRIENQIKRSEGELGGGAFPELNAVCPQTFPLPPPLGLVCV